MSETSNFDSAAPGSPWSGPRLLVPVTVQALVVTQDYMSAASWSILQTNYNNLQVPYKVPVDPLPCQTGGLLLPGGQAGQVWTGIVLHWTLPESLRHGTQSAGSLPSNGGAASPPSGEIVYPLIPNRWLVVRTYQNPSGKPNDPSNRVTKSWVLESDDVSTTAPANSPLSQPNFWIQNTQTPAYLGQNYTLDQWLQNWPAEQKSPPQSVPLTAVGVGDATYPAYIANISNVLSFMDDMSDLPGPFSNNSYVPLTYMVFGWYSDPTADPLYGATESNWEDLMSELNWAVDNPDGYPSQILCHAMTYEVKWYGPNGPTQSGVPSVTSTPSFVPLIAVGNTSVEALAALIEQQVVEVMKQSPAAGEQVADIMEAFQYNLIQLWDQPGGQVQVDQQRHQACFGSGPGGTIWEVIAPQNDNQSPPVSPPQQGQTQPVLTPEQASLLGQLNALQKELDRQQRILSSMQWELYAFWWLKWAFFMSQTGNRVNAYLQTLLKSVQSQTNDVNAIIYGSGGVQGLQSIQAQLTALLGDSLQLVSSEAPRFWQPVDPVVLICGAKGSFKHGPEARLNPDGTLPCRITGEAITSITVTAGSKPSQATVLASALNPNLDAPGSQPSVPAELTDLFNNITALFGESMLLDTTEAGMIAQLAMPNLNPPDPSITFAQLVQIIQNQQTCFWNSIVYPSIDQSVAATATGFDGDIPYVISIAPWTPPWSPLFMDWQVTWYPSYYYVVNPNSITPPHNPPYPLSGWAYNELDYSWTSATAPTSQPGYILQGRTLLTPQATDVFVARLEELLGSLGQSGGSSGGMSSPLTDPTYGYSPPPDVVEALGEVLKIVSQWDMLSQNMSGFHYQLIQQDTGQHIQCTDPTFGPLIGTGDQAIPIYDNGTGQSLIGYNPIRAGHFVLNQLWIVDDFGQVFNIGEALTNQPSKPFSPTAVSDWLTTPGTYDPTPMQLPPRVVQPIRLSFSFVSAEDDSQETAYVPGANPVCGWVLPNHLDNSLAIYDASGLALGELQLVGGSTNKRARWTPAPDSPAPVGAPPAIANVHLRSFVEGVLNQPDGGGPALGQLMDVIDETLWTIDPLGARTDQSLSVLIGRPLALVRASVAYEISGQPVYDKSLYEMSTSTQPTAPNFQNTAGFTEVSFTVELGSLELPGDGLLGYFLGDNYQQFNSVHLPDSDEQPPYVVQNNLQLQLNSDLTSPPTGIDLSSPVGESAAYITMLVDPRGSIHASTGILPVQEISIPAWYVQPALSQMEVTFQTGPLLTATEELQMPLPASNKGDWSWIQQPSVTVWQETTDLTNANPQAILSDIPLSVREGWLKLSGALADGKNETE